MSRLFDDVEAAAAAQPVKTCCARLYETAWARLLLGESFHPGGLALTERLGILLQLRPGQRVLDVAAGQGVSAVFLAQRFGCEVVGVDYGQGSLVEGTANARKAGLAGRVRFCCGDSEALSLIEGEFDAVICECAFCTFPDQAAAAGELYRVLKPGGRVALSDLTRSGPLPGELDTLLAWIACIASARPAGDYMSHLERGGFSQVQVEAHDDALSALVKDIRLRMLGAELMVRLRQFEVAGADFEEAKAMIHVAAECIEVGLLGYAVFTATKRP